MDEKLINYLNNLADEIIKSAKFSMQSEEQKSQNKEKIIDYYNQKVLDVMLGFMTKDELDQLEKINFESEEGVRQFGQLAANLPGMVFLEVGDKLRMEAEKIKSSGIVPE